MRTIWLLSLCLILCACSAHRKAEICTEGQDVFSETMKVQLADDTIKAGTELTVVVRNFCPRPGPVAKLIARDLQADGHKGSRSYSFVVHENISRKELSQLAQKDRCVLGISNVGVDRVLSFFDDPLVSDQGHLESIQADESYPKFYDASLGTRPHTIVAIIDTGVDLDHPDLKNQIWFNEDEIAGNGLDDDLNGYVDDVNGYNFASGHSDPNPEGTWPGWSHGTHVAGLVGAQADNRLGVSGVIGMGVKIMALNVFGKRAGAYSYNTENAIRYAANNGADVINLSLGGSTVSASYRAAIQYAISKGATVIAAAGNDGREFGSSFSIVPAVYGPVLKGMLTVGSIDVSTREYSPFSNRGSSVVEIVAPGSEDSSQARGLLSTFPNSRYGRLQGTSMSAPITSGAAALTIQLLRALGYAPQPSRVEEALVQSAMSDENLVAKVNQGRVLNLANLARRVTDDYPKLEVPEAGVRNELAENGIPDSHERAQMLTCR